MLLMFHLYHLLSLLRKASLSVFQCFYPKGFWKDVFCFYFVCLFFMALYHLYGLFPAIKDHGSNCNSSGFLFKLFGFYLMNAYRNLDCKCCPFPTLYKKRTQNRVYNQSSKSPFAFVSRLHRLPRNDSYRFIVLEFWLKDLYKYGVTWNLVPIVFT